MIGQRLRACCTNAISAYFVILSIAKNLVFTIYRETLHFVQGDENLVCATGSKVCFFNILKKSGHEGKK